MIEAATIIDVSANPVHPGTLKVKLRWAKHKRWVTDFDLGLMGEIVKHGGNPHGGGYAIVRTSKTLEAGLCLPIKEEVPK